MIMIMTKNVNTVMSKTLRPLNLTGGNKILFFYFFIKISLLFKSDCKNLYIGTRNVQINAVLLNFPFI